MADTPATVTDLSADLESALTDAILDGGGLLAEIVDRVAAATGHTGRTDAQSSFYKRLGKAAGALAEAGTVQKAQIKIPQGRGTWYGPQGATPPADYDPAAEGAAEAKPEAPPADETEEATVIEETPAPKKSRKKKAEAVEAEAVEAEEWGDSDEKAAERYEKATGKKSARTAKKEAEEAAAAEERQKYALDLRKPESLQKTVKQERALVEKETKATHQRFAERAEEQIKSLPEKITPEEAVHYVLYYEARENLHSDAALFERFLLGVVARRVSEQAEYGDAAMKRLNDLTGVHHNTIRECRRLAESFGDNAKLFMRWLRSMRHRLSGRPARWFHVQALIGTYSDATVLGPDELADALVRQIEKAAERVEQAKGVEIPEGTMLALTDAAQGLREEGLARLAEQGVEMETAAAVQIPRDPAFMRFVSLLPCAVTGEMPPEGGWEETRAGTDPHHTGKGGTGIKGSDYTCIPLSREAHNVFHSEGPKAFRRKYGVHPAIIMAQTLHLWITGQKADLPSAMLN